MSESVQQKTSARQMRYVEARCISDEEWACAELQTKLVFEAPYNPLTTTQIKQIREWSTEALRSQRRHPYVHNSVNLTILIFLFAVEIGAITEVPVLMQRLLPHAGDASIFFAAVLAAMIHGFVAYSVTVYSLHEGAAHSLIINVQGKATRVLEFICNNACRLFFADPVFYRDNHLLHHQKFATRGDGAFSNFVSSKRILRSLIPYIHLLSLSDYNIHRPRRLTKSRVAMIFTSITYQAGLGFLAYRYGGLIYAVLVVGVIGPWIGFSLDRLRETSEHILMPLNYYNGTRNLGTGLWALLIGGGPWGQPCHLSHHLGAHLAWYNQLRLHRKLTEILDREQLAFFTVESGLTGYPDFVATNWRKLIAIENQVKRLATTVSGSPSNQECSLSAPASLQVHRLHTLEASELLPHT